MNIKILLQESLSTPNLIILRNFQYRPKLLVSYKSEKVKSMDIIAIRSLSLCS